MFPCICVFLGLVLTNKLEYFYTVATNDPKTVISHRLMTSLSLEREKTHMYQVP